MKQMLWRNPFCKVYLCVSVSLCFSLCEHECVPADLRDSALKRNLSPKQNACRYHTSISYCVCGAAADSGFRTILFRDTDDIRCARPMRCVPQCAPLPARRPGFLAVSATAVLRLPVQHCTERRCLCWLAARVCGLKARLHSGLKTGWICRAESADRDNAVSILSRQAQMFH